MQQQTAAAVLEGGGVFTMPFVPVASVFLVPVGLLAPWLFFATLRAFPTMFPGEPVPPEIMIKLGGNNDVTKGQLICLHQ